MNSILDTIKKMIGVESGNTDFDTDIIVHVNSAFMALNQLGVGPTEPYFIVDKSQEWSSFLEDSTSIEAVKSYIYLKVKILFDPPSNSTVLDAISRQITEFEWRMNWQIEKNIPIVEGGIVNE